MHLAGPRRSQAGDRVYTGQPIGIVGDTGDATPATCTSSCGRRPAGTAAGSRSTRWPSLQAWDSWSSTTARSI